MDNTLGLDLLRLVAVVLLVLANGFFVSAEFSLVSVRRTRIAELVAQGNLSAKAVQKAIDNPDRVIAATQLGITIASLGLGWIGEPALSHILHPLIVLFPVDIQTEVSHSISAGIAFSLITFLHVVVGELAPKSIALQDPERTALIVAAPTLWTESLFKPVIWLLNGAGNVLLRLVNIQPASGHHLVHSVEEIKMLVSASTAGGVIEQPERDMIESVFDFGELLVRQVMVPRTEIIAVEADMPINAVFDLVTQTSYTKMPVFEGSLDSVLGVLHVKDLLRVVHSADNHERTARSLVRETIFVPETISVNALLRQFRDNRQHIAIVLDEYGGTAGLVTLEDLLEEIVGEVSDQFDAANPEIVTLPDGTILIDGLTLIEEVNDQLGLALNDPHYDTIAGYALGKLGRIPKPGDVYEGATYQMRVESMDGLRIARLALKRIDRSQPQQTP